MSTHLRAAAIARFVFASLETSIALALFLLGGHIRGKDIVSEIISAFFLVFAGALALSGVLGLITAYGLLERRPWARVLGIVVAGLELPGFPVGTAFGAYTLWVLLHRDTKALFVEELPPLPPPPRPDLKWE